MARVADRHGADPANVATRWVLDKPGVAGVIVGAPSSRHLESNLRTFALVLDDEDRRVLDEVVAAAAGPSGDVYDLERVKDGSHAAIMKYNLNRSEAE